MNKLRHKVNVLFLTYFTNILNITLCLNYLSIYLEKTLRILIHFEK